MGNYRFVVIIALASYCTALAFSNFFCLSAHYIKDRHCNTTRYVVSLESSYKWALSGTPLQNRVGELYLLVRFLQITPYSYYFCKDCECKVLDYSPNSSCPRCPHKSVRHVCWWNKGFEKHTVKAVPRRAELQFLHFSREYYLHNALPFKTLTTSSSNKSLFGARLLFRSRKLSSDFNQMNFRGAVNSFSEEQNSSTSAETTSRKVIEHICLLKAKADLSDKNEKDMLDFLYTCQYQMPGILAISLGRISYQKLESYTHAVFMRFQKKEDLAKFYENPFYIGVLKDHVTPYCHELTYFDYESEVEDDILPIFRKGEEFNFGVEFILLLAFKESLLGEVVDDALTSFSKLLMEFPSLIVQATK
nr:hypothetical protein [Tanacetum cinerariifolium]